MVFIDCFPMKYKNTGLYSFCDELSRALVSNAGSGTPERYGFHVPQEMIGIFGEEHTYIPIRKLTRYFFWDRRIRLWHSTWQKPRRIPKGCPTVNTIHDLNFLYEDVSERKKNIYMRRIEKSLRNSQCIVAISEFVKRDILNYIDVRDIPVHTIYNGCNRFHGELLTPSYTPLRPFIFSVGTILPKKNFHVLPCLLECNDMELVLAGNISEYANTIMSEARRWNVEDRVHIVGPVSEGEKHWYLSKCSAFAFPSIAEGFGLPVIEAMSYGKPVFLSKHTCLPEIGGSEAFYFNYEFEPRAMQEEFVNGMDLYQSDAECRARIVREHALKFSWDETARKYRQIYNQLLQ